MMTRTTKILVVDDEPAMREVLKARLEDWHFDVIVASGGQEALQVMRSSSPDIVLTDVVLLDMSGHELLDLLKPESDDLPVITILMTAYGTIATAVDAMKRGAWDFLAKPIDYPKLKSALEAAEHELDLRSATRRVQAEQAETGLGALVGHSRAMRQLYELIATVAPTNASVLTVGESGTGKEFVARTIHELSRVRHGPFIAINAAAIPESLAESELFGHERGAFTGAVNSRPGCFELADKGTLFLDEISEMPMALQPKLLRVLEDDAVRRIGSRREVPFTVRVIAATNRDPADAVAQGLLREDLYYRLNVFTVSLPPLRERTEDIPRLAQHFIRQFNEKHRAAVDGLAPAALERLQGHRWPGNVRELRNAIERALVMAKSGHIRLDHLPATVRLDEAAPGTPLVLPAGVTAAEAERRVILETLKRHGNNKTRAARELGLDVKTLRNKLKSYQLDSPAS